MEKRQLVQSEKQRLLWNILLITVFKPFLIASAFCISYGLFFYVYTNLTNLVEALVTVFVISFLFAIIYYLVRSGSLIFDMIMDYKSSDKVLGTFHIVNKKSSSNKYYLETADPAFPLIKTDRKVSEKVPSDKQVDLIISSSNRVYRYNPLIENFRIDKLI